ncbi:tRNA wybutosine-synthesizing protein 2 [Nannizzia gypsea CBS 118893]|uniref:tRNA wybutosine-synthesizing protein 2 n=1 Tax=Arthroderma gypseum (strain ATCC MYA-4604 / CBS 118893) TaxID=535722 RepID=E4UMV9_ARTGP|nr:tRNA wybutosine-synthesizing protein 2 [Nannizzia gypsea CBS 118893]EFR00313.1 tRNA wybutosine-synthesizing protein 2 [Nannizzia gypsea CBS 118893]
MEDPGSQKPERRPRKKAENPSVQRGVRLFIENHLEPSFSVDNDVDLDSLLSSVSKRFTIYGPLLLLPPNFFNKSPQWESFISLLSRTQLQKLYACIAEVFTPMGVTHVAVNAPISLTTHIGNENKVRGPTDLTPLYGDFGPIPAADQKIHPSELDLQQAFWVKTVQNSRITQVWAPLYTMFSRGNVVEKARILGLESRFDGLNEQQLCQPVQKISVIDLYAGIGYFAFSYLKMGVARVWAWELNGWSIEGLRRGCEANKWEIRILRVDSLGSVHGIDDLLDELCDDNLRVVAFHGDNTFAVGIMQDIKAKMEARNAWKPIRHANLGLLPSSRDTWDAATALVDPLMGGWAHVHENVDVHEIPKKRAEIVAEFKKLQSSRKMIDAHITNEVECVHVEKVKTYAPGVMHCVFDINIQYLHSSTREMQSKNT